MMKTLILYATKNGAARVIAERMAKQIDGAVIHDLKQEKIPNLKDFDRIIIGSSVYAGLIRKEAKTFISHHKAMLKEKTYGLFISGLEASGENTYFESNFPADILAAAKVKMFLGGIFDPAKAGAVGRFIMKAVAKKVEYMDSIDEEKIAKFVVAMK